jgi:transcriptional regulator of aromatic amino acid metabolism
MVLLGQMARQCRVSRDEFVRLVECSMDRPEYDEKIGKDPTFIGGGGGFPGNVRELENILERAVIFAEGAAIDTADLDLAGAGAGADAVVPPADAKRSPGTLKENERTLIGAALAGWEGNRTRAAAELGITRRTLFNKLRQYGLD